MSYEARVLKRLENWIIASESSIREWCLENEYDCYEGLDVLKDGRLKVSIARFEKDGFDEDDAVNIQLLTEEFNPIISEEESAFRAKFIFDKYKKGVWNE